MAIQHGTRSCYVKNKCRRPECRAASAVYEKLRQRKIRRARGVPEQVGPPLNLLSDVQVAWLAGLFEGEGCVSRKGKTRIGLHVQMTDHDIIQRLREITGVGHVFGPLKTQKAHYKPTWVWAVQVDSRARQIAALLYPQLGIRRRAKIDSLGAGPGG